MTDITRRELVAIGAAAGAAMVAPGRADAQVPSGRLVTIDARPDPLTVDTATTAVIVVDMQNDFGSEGGMFHRAGIDISGIRKAIAPTANVLAAARANGVRIVYLKMAYLPDLSDLGAPGSVNRARHVRLGVGEHVSAPDGRPSRILVRDTWNTAIVDGLDPEPDDIVIYKTRFSGFYKTDLDETLRGLRVKHLIVTGCTTSICVESTVRDAMFRDYLCVLLADCMSEPIGSDFARSNHDASLLSTEALLGWVSDSTRLVNALGQ
jgi:ureidoacrylate peracid hydrolase